MKKFIQSKVFRESEADVAPDAAAAAGQGKACRAAIDTRRQIAFKAWLESEADAAAIINAMSFCVGHKSDLAVKARGYASKLMLYVERINGLLPSDIRGRYSALSVTTRGNPALTPKSTEQAAFVLVEYLLNHAEETDRIALPALATPKSEAGKRLLKRMHDERHELVEWIRTSGLHRSRNARASREQDDTGIAHGEARPAKGYADAAQSNGTREDPPANAMCHEGSRISYSPRQTVRWM